jgi:hypothetical protein
MRVFMGNSKILLLVLLCFFLGHARAETLAKCAHIDSVIRLRTLEMNYCLELHSSNKSGSKQYVRYLRRTLRNISAEPIETEFVSDLNFYLIIGNDERMISRMFATPATDSPEAEHWQIPYNVIQLAPGESHVQRYRLSDYMIEKPNKTRQYSISIRTRLGFRFLREPKSKLAERMSRTKEDDAMDSRSNVSFYDVHIR